MVPADAARSAARPLVRPAPLPPAVYWRRRCVALLIGLTVVTLVAWALKSAIGGFAPAVPSAAATSGVPGSASGAPAGGSAAAGTTAPAGSTAPAGAGSPRTASHNLLRPCPAGDVVLSLFSSQASYTLTQTPQFEIDVVSTASGTCTFDIGARHVIVQITAAGRAVWSSADCAEGQASLVTRLRRGVPTIVPITWDGQHSSAGCPVPGSPAAAGTYTATASDGSATSNALTFRVG